jgi:hypothetical protein
MQTESYWTHWPLLLLSVPVLVGACCLTMDGEPFLGAFFMAYAALVFVIFYIPKPPLVTPRARWTVMIDGKAYRGEVVSVRREKTGQGK